MKVGHTKPIIENQKLPLLIWIRQSQYCMLTRLLSRCLSSISSQDLWTSQEIIQQTKSTGTLTSSFDLKCHNHYPCPRPSHSSWNTLVDFSLHWWLHLFIWCLPKLRADTTHWVEGSVQTTGLSEAWWQRSTVNSISSGEEEPRARTFPVTSRWCPHTARLLRQNNDCNYTESLERGMCVLE